MKNLIILISLIFSSKLCIAQSLVLDSCGLDTKAVLNQCEADYFNETKKKHGTFDFTNKKVAFAYGNFGRGLISKKDYFERWGRKYYADGEGVMDQLFILSAEEKENSGGYDVIIVSWSKIKLTEKHKKAIIKKLKN